MGTLLSMLIRRKFTTEPDPRSRRIKEGTFAFASMNAADSVVATMLRRPLTSNAFFNVCANDSVFRKMSTESRMPPTEDFSVNIGAGGYSPDENKVIKLGLIIS